MRQICGFKIVFKEKIKNWKKLKKGVAICKKEWYNNEVAWGKHKQQKSLKTQKKAFKSNERDFKKLFKNFEKSVDKRKWMWYNNSRTVERGW